MEKPKITDFISRAVNAYPLDPAIYTSLEEYITYQQLSLLITALAKQLEENGVHENVRVAVILPNTAEALILFYAVTSVATIIPLSPNYSTAELKHYLTITHAQVIITNEDVFTSIKLTAEELKLPALTIDTDSAIFSLKHSNEYQLSAQIGSDSAADIAAILLTSGTTAVSKVVPLTHINLMGPAEVHREAYKVRRTDRSVNVIPLFHIYGITGSVLVAAAAGSSVICLPEFSAPAFFEILKNLNIDWYAAGPAVQSAIAEYAHKINAQPQDYALSIIRSGGAALSMNTVMTLEKHFNAVVLPGYGLTETGGLGATNLVPPSKINAHSSGFVTGVDINIVDEERNILPAKQIGQIIVSGPSLTAGYENEKDSSSFWPDGWFATGDLGYLDDEGYLYITGRIKDVINRGGDKISPYEVESAFLMHPEVLEAVVVPVPHPSLGEIPMAVIVLAADSGMTEQTLKLFLQSTLSAGKIPVQIIFTERIPKSSAGKIMRASMYHYIQEHPDEFFELKGEHNTQEQAAEFIKIENELTDIWQEILKINKVGINENYFALGGDSLGVAFLFSEIERRFNVVVPAEIILTNGTIHEMAAYIYQKGEKAATVEFIVPLHISASKNMPIFCIHALNGDAFTYRKLTDALGAEYSVYGAVFKPRSSRISHPVQLAQLAGVYIEDMRTIQPEGPYVLLGYSLGGAIAYEIARQLRSQQQEVAIVALLDTRFEFTEQLVQQTFATLRNKMLEEIKKYHKTSAQLQNEFAIAKMLQYAFINYELMAYEGTILYFYAELADNTYAEKSLQKLRDFAKQVEVVSIHSKHANLISEPAVQDIAQYLKSAIINHSK